jgi:hypothetical protein
MTTSMTDRFGLRTPQLARIALDHQVLKVRIAKTARPEADH